MLAAPVKETVSSVNSEGGVMLVVVSAEKDEVTDSWISDG